MNRLQLQRYSGGFPRVRSNSLSTLTVSAPPSSSSRQVLPGPPRLPSEGPKQPHQSQQHSQLALTPPGLQPPLFPCTPPLTPSFGLNSNTNPSSSSVSSHPSETHRATKRQRLKYHLDVGAYGIPKHRSHRHNQQCAGFSTASSLPHTSLSVQIGEDAYFVRDNAMGIADGVGGWARSAAPYSTHHPSPSALFSRRLMHFCSAEIDTLSNNGSTDLRSIPSSGSSSSHRPPSARFSFEHHLKPRQSPHAPPSYDQYSFSELEDSLHSSLDELSEGIDVLQILERAYDSTVKAHVAPSSSSPLTTGSSTALLAVLDHPPPSSAGSQSTTLPQYPEAPQKNYAAGSLQPFSEPSPNPSSADSWTPTLSTSKSATIPKQALSSSSPSCSPTSTSTSNQSDATGDSLLTEDLPTSPINYDAVLHIAHLGDCMGMLVRGDTIVWRSDEMWWGYNHPLQLGPPSACTGSPPQPTNPDEPLHLPVLPHTFTLPVLADDILILASDGLSDNLWDEDILDEILKFRGQQILGTSSPTPTNLLRRKAFAGLLSEALCSRAKHVSERRPSLSASQTRHRSSRTPSSSPKFTVIAEEPYPTTVPLTPSVSLVTSEETDEEVPFGRRARQAGKVFRGGKHDDISVIVAVISPVASSSQAHDSTAVPSAKSNSNPHTPSQL
ncbi:hypothetical protein CPB83DRAFT_910953 [Crepidotus variabilis]|uniref:Protein phosphatase n=1 Tax=Crepidotus variabilis TaxID=179855 RepID=A0A9P6E5X7_9AGAR|nr:hypothetical protein CPB83DRAFT_910953 [Crepidotus variabilis]